MWDAGQNLLKIQRALGVPTPHKGRKVREEIKILRELVPKLDTNVLKCSEENLPSFIREFKVFKHELMGFDRDVARQDYSFAFKKALVHLVHSTDGLSYLKRMGMAAGLTKTKPVPTTKIKEAELMARISALEEENLRLRMKYEPEKLMEDSMIDAMELYANEVKHDLATKEELTIGRS